MNPTQRDQAMSLARHEVRAPTWGVSQQFLEVHEVPSDEDGQPSIAQLGRREFKIKRILDE